MGKLFVTLFAFTPTLKINLQWLLHPDTRICSQLKPGIVTGFWLRDSLYRDTAPVSPTKILYRDSLLAPIKLVPRHA
jgi:hypothetical protein